MNFTSFAFALGIAALVAATGWFIDWGAGKYGDWSNRKRRIARRISAVATVLVGIFVYISDSELRGTTLFEVAGPWQETGGRIWTVEIENPGVEHTLMVYPFTDGFDSATRSVILKVQFSEPGGAILLEQTFEHVTSRRTGKHSNHLTWEDAIYRLVPRKAGPHHLLVESFDGLTPVNLHLRIADPKKRDGKRAPGY
jgi:hypothetical protein